MAFVNWEHNRSACVSTTQPSEQHIIRATHEVPSVANGCEASEHISAPAAARTRSRPHPPQAERPGSRAPARQVCGAAPAGSCAPLAALPGSPPVAHEGGVVQRWHVKHQTRTHARFQAEHELASCCTNVSMHEGAHELMHRCPMATHDISARGSSAAPTHHERQHPPSAAAPLPHHSDKQPHVPCDGWVNHRGNSAYRGTPV